MDDVVARQLSLQFGESNQEVCVVSEQERPTKMALSWRTSQTALSHSSQVFNSKTTFPRGQESLILAHESRSLSILAVHRRHAYQKLIAHVHRCEFLVAGCVVSTACRQSLSHWLYPIPIYVQLLWAVSQAFAKRETEGYKCLGDRIAVMFSANTKVRKEAFQQHPKRHEGLFVPRYPQIECRLVLYPADLSATRE